MQIPLIDWNSSNIVEETREAFNIAGGGRFYNIWTEEEYNQYLKWDKCLRDWYHFTSNDDKKAFQVTKSDNQHGWIPHDEEKGGETTNPKRKGDHKEQLNISYLRELPNVPESLKGELEKTLPLMQKKGEEVFTLFEKVLNVEAGTLVNLINDLNDHQLRAAWYLGAETEEKDNAISCGEHKDRNAVTLLFSESPNKKLQIRAKDKEYKDIEYVGNSMVVNVGIILEVWTAGYLYAPIHRVLNDVEESFTTGYFMQPNLNSVITHVGPNAQDWDDFSLSVEEIRDRLRKAHMQIKKNQK